MVAANIGAGSTVGAAGLGYRDGIAAWWWVGSAAIGSVILAFTVGPRIRRVAAQHGLSTVGDFLEHRYGPGVRAAVSALLWLSATTLLAWPVFLLAPGLVMVVGRAQRGSSVCGGPLVA